jgi:hypothetical protein
MLRLILSCLGLLAMTQCGLAQIVTVTGSAVPAMIPIPIPGQAGLTMKVDGTISLPAGYTMTDIECVVGSINNGVFTPHVPLAKKIATPSQTNPPALNYTYTTRFDPTAFLAGTHSVQVVVKGKKPSSIPFGPPVPYSSSPVYSTVIFP